MSTGQVTRTCQRCGGATDKIYNLCDSCLEAWVTDSRASQGLPLKEDRPEILGEIVELIRKTWEEAAQ